MVIAEPLPCSDGFLEKEKLRFACNFFSSRLRLRAPCSSRRPEWDASPPGSSSPVQAPVPSQRLCHPSPQCERRIDTSVKRGTPIFNPQSEIPNPPSRPTQHKPIRKLKTGIGIRIPGCDLLYHGSVSHHLHGERHPGERDRKFPPNRRI